MCFYIKKDAIFKLLISRKKLSIVFVILYITFLSHARSLNCTEEQSWRSKNQTVKYVIFDTDMGADDAWALQIILKAAKVLNVKVLAITTVNGNTNVENAIKNTYRILDGANSTDIPIYEGASEPFIPVDLTKHQFFGVNGFSDVEVWKPEYPSDIRSVIQKEKAVEIIRNLVMKHPHEVSLLCIGPLTNIALAIRTYPEIKDNIKDVYIMGGNYKGRGNTVAGAEYNFFTDPVAAHIVLNSLKCPIAIVPIECKDSTVNVTLTWRFDVLGKVNNKNVELLNKAEMIALRNSKHFVSYDGMAAMAFVFPKRSIKRVNPYSATVELHGEYTRGQMVIDHYNNSYNVAVIEEVNDEEFKKILLWSVSESSFNKETYC